MRKPEKTERKGISALTTHAFSNWQRFIETMQMEGIEIQTKTSTRPKKIIFLTSAPDRVMKDCFNYLMSEFQQANLFLISNNGKEKILLNDKNNPGKLRFECEKQFDGELVFTKAKFSSDKHNNCVGSILAEVKKEVPDSPISPLKGEYDDEESDDEDFDELFNGIKPNKKEGDSSDDSLDDEGPPLKKQNKTLTDESSSSESDHEMRSPKRKKTPKLKNEPLASTSHENPVENKKNMSKENLIAAISTLDEEKQKRLLATVESEKLFEVFREYVTEPHMTTKLTKTLWGRQGNLLMTIGKFCMDMEKMTKNAPFKLNKQTQAFELACSQKCAVHCIDNWDCKEKVGRKPGKTNKRKPPQKKGTE